MQTHRSVMYCNCNVYLLNVYNLNCICIIYIYAWSYPKNNVEMLIHPLKRKLILSNPLLFLAPIPQAATSKDGRIMKNVKISFWRCCRTCSGSFCGNLSYFKTKQTCVCRDSDWMALAQNRESESILRGPT